MGHTDTPGELGPAEAVSGRIGEIRHTLKEMLLAAEGLVCAIKVQQTRLEGLQRVLADQAEAPTGQPAGEGPR
jgi:hypothetical protein